jgi:SSS family solute:Na+ symporter
LTFVISLSFVICPLTSSSSSSTFSALDGVVLISALALVLGVGFGLARRGRDAARFMTAGRALPGWAIGLAIFGSYVSSISFMANPGKSFAEDWNAFVFSLSILPAVWLANRAFVPLYRRSGVISAYELLERRFGRWARLYAVLCYLLTQMARMGTIVYLLALAFYPFVGWNLRVLIVCIGLMMTTYTLLGGMEAAIWAGVVQSVIVVAGAVACVASVAAAVPGGAGEVFRVAAEHHKFSLGGAGPELGRSTIWVMLLYGLTINLQNFGIDQSYVQRYVTARSDRDAARAMWLVPLAYLPVAAAFFFVGTGLFVISRLRPDLVPPTVRADDALPQFIAAGLAPGVRGLVLAAVLAAALDSNLNCMATITWCDIYKPLLRPGAGERESLWVLRGSMLGWGALGTGVALAMTLFDAKALDAWWQMAGLFGGGMVGLFLLGLIGRRVGREAAAIALALGIGVIVWITMAARGPGPPAVHPLLAIAAGTATIVLAGVLLGALLERQRSAAAR